MKYSKLKQYKYKLEEDEFIHTGILGYEVSHPFFMLDSDGLLIVYAPYMWDGSSGPTVDSDNTMTPSLAHDAGYQMIRLGLIPPETKPLWDKLYKKMLLDRGTTEFRACLHYQGVSVFGGDSCVPGDIRTPKIIEVA